jgi:hypothetical protein
LQGFLHDDVAFGKAVLGLAGEAAQFAAVPDGEEDHRGDGGEHDAGEFEGGHHDHDDAAGHEDDLTEHVGQAAGDHVIDLREVGGDAAGEFADATLGEEGHGQRDDAGVGVEAKAVEGELADALKGLDVVEAGGGLDAQDDEQGDDGAAQGGRPTHFGQGFELGHGQVQQASGEVGEGQAQHA